MIAMILRMLPYSPVKMVRRKVNLTRNPRIKPTLGIFGLALPLIQSAFLGVGLIVELHTENSLVRDHFRLEHDGRGSSVFDRSRRGR